MYGIGSIWVCLWQKGHEKIYLDTLISTTKKYLNVCLRKLSEKVVIVYDDTIKSIGIKKDPGSS